MYRKPAGIAKSQGLGRRIEEVTRTGGGESKAGKKAGKKKEGSGNRHRFHATSNPETWYAGVGTEQKISTHA